jgi:hypothetical protein
MPLIKDQFYGICNKLTAFLRYVFYNLHYCRIQDGAVDGRYIFWAKG